MVKINKPPWGLNRKFTVFGSVASPEQFSFLSARVYCRVVLATLRSWKSLVCSWKFKSVVKILTFTCFLFRRSLSMPWSVYTLCKFREQYSMGMWHHTKKGSQKALHMKFWVWSMFEGCGFSNSSSMVRSSFIIA